MTILPKRPSRGFYFALMMGLGGLVFYFFWPLFPLGGPFGYFDAKQDVKNGQLSLKIGLWDTGMWKEWKDAVREKYEINIGGRVPSSFGGSGFTGSYDRAYNAVQRAEIIKRYGRDVVEEERKRIYDATRRNINQQNKE
jgi:hypothetical protein